jgi:hypothetical protein
MWSYFYLQLSAYTGFSLQTVTLCYTPLLYTSCQLHSTSYIEGFHGDMNIDDPQGHCAV